MSVPNLLHRSARRHPDRPLWITPDTTVDYREGEQRMNRVARSLSERADRGSRVALLMPNRFEGLEAFLAVMAAGMITVPLNARLSAEEHAFIVTDAGCEICIYDAEFAHTVAEIKRLAPNVVHWIAVDRAAADVDVEDYNALATIGPGHPVDIELSPDDVAWLFYTSGTTGTPKGAMETHRNLLTMAEQMLMDLVPDAACTDVMFHAAPISHGSASCMLPHLAVGAANTFPLTRSFESEVVFEAIQRYGVTTSFLAPTMIKRLTSDDRRHQFNLTSLKTIVYGGGPMYAEDLDAAMDAFGPIFSQIYGQGEAPMTISILPKSEHAVTADPIVRQRMTSVGRPGISTEVRIVDEDDRPVGPNVTGEITVRGDLVMPGYWNRPEATADTLRGGWLHTGDVGHLDVNGYLYITDRMKDLIVSGGTNIYPREIEEVLAKHPDIVEVTVIGVPDRDWGESVKALVVRRADSIVTEADIIAFSRDNMASYKKPRTVQFLDELPKNAYGKILKRQLRDAHWAGQARRV